MVSARCTRRPGAALRPCLWAHGAPSLHGLPRTRRLPGARGGRRRAGHGAFLPMMGFWVEAGAADSRRVTAAHSSRPSAYSRCPGLAMAPAASRRLSKALRPDGPERPLRGREAAAGGRPAGRRSAAGAYGKCSPGARAQGDLGAGAPGAPSSHPPHGSTAFSHPLTRDWCARPFGIGWVGTGWSPLATVHQCDEVTAGAPSSDPRRGGSWVPAGPRHHAA